MTSDSKPSARALASRQNGARSRGPKTAAGKAISARNALKHGLSARTVVLDGEDAAAFQAFQAALRAELAPAGVLQHDLVSRIALGLWRARRSDRTEAALIASYLERARGTGEGRNLGLAVIRDAHGPRALDTLLRYRGSAHAELFRALGALKALQAEAAANALLTHAASRVWLSSVPRHAERPIAWQTLAEVPAARRNKPETRSRPGVPRPPARCRRARNPQWGSRLDQRLRRQPAPRATGRSA
jgi:hypothetical protein